MTGLSVLEHVVLGIVWKKGSCTPYAVCKEFKTSPTPQFSGSAGSIYPLVRRLENRQLLSSCSSLQGRRSRRLYSITTEGEKYLQDWLRPPVPLDDARSLFDPLRTRMYFLAALPPTARQEYLADAEIKIRSQIPVLKEDMEHYRQVGDEFSRLASSSMMYILRARLKWIGEVQRQFTQSR